jgi:hypothetical protein
MNEFGDGADEDSLNREPATPDTPGEYTASPEPSLTDSRASDAPSSAPIKRGRGRPKGLGKVPGSGRQKGGIKSYSAPEVRAELLKMSNAVEKMARIANGEKVYCGAGPNHKPDWRYPTLQEQQKAAEFILDKVLSALQSTEVSGSGGKDLFPPAAAFDADGLARVLFDVGKEQYVREISEKGMVVVNAAALPLAQRVLDVRQSSPEDGPAAALSSSSSSSHRESSSGESISEGHPMPARGEASGEHTSHSPNLHEPEPEEGTTKFMDNGAYITWVHRPDGSKKWDVRDWLDAHHGYRRSLADALAFAQSLKRDR